MQARATLIAVEPATPLYLTNDDDPGQFSSRTLTVVNRVVIRGRHGVLVRIEPSVEVGRGATEQPPVALSMAILIPRTLLGTIEDIADGSLDTPKSVFVYGLEDPGQSPRTEYEVEDLWMALWGLVDRRYRRVSRRRR